MKEGRMIALGDCSSSKKSEKIIKKIINIIEEYS